jgi:NitT/TauT family transport system substrate-binding protein
LILTLLALVVACGDAHPGEPVAASGGEPRARVVRLGHFPNVTHAHGLVAHAMTRSGKGWFEQRLGPELRVEWFTYNAGPSAMEALLTNDLDVTYVGPSPALNAHIKSRGDDVRVLSGATSGGAALVVRGEGRIAQPADFAGKRVGTPQLGNTQDIACRAWLTEHGFRITQTGGDVLVVPTSNPDQLDLFRRGELDAVWTVEPWVSRLETEAGGRVFLEEQDALTTVLVASARFVRESPDLVRAIVAAHAELTTWIAEHAEEARGLVRAELREETKRDVPAELVERCWSRMRLEDAVTKEAFEQYVRKAQQAGFLKDAGDLSRLMERGP